MAVVTACSLDGIDRIEDVVKGIDACRRLCCSVVLGQRTHRDPLPEGPDHAKDTVATICYAKVTKKGIEHEPRFCVCCVV